MLNAFWSRSLNQIIFESLQNRSITSTTLQVIFKKGARKTESTKLELKLVWATDKKTYVL